MSMRLLEPFHVVGMTLADMVMWEMHLQSEHYYVGMLDVQPIGLVLFCFFLARVVELILFRR